MTTVRYQILDKLGEGGMGAVFKARDLLTGEVVALKQVNTEPPDLEFTSKKSDKDGAVALAGEFRTLAALHHPHVVAVLDYGFDTERKPYYTMQLLENAMPITTASAEMPRDEQIRLIVEMLQALTYLHRHTIIHRDLKPANVLVTDQGVVKVLDFGLAKNHENSMKSGDSTGLVGTLAYIAPEIFNEEKATIQSDLFAAGVIIYEILAGRHPFKTKNVALLISSVLTSQPDLSVFDDKLAEVLDCLLQKNPAQRYTSADEVIRALMEATDQPLLAESSALRESFLQASTFVGREAEMSQLRAALKAAQAGKGSAWLIGGESGVGKSRLMEEVRTRALVDGALVLRGQAVAEGGLPYQFWREVMRRLVLTTPLSDFEASVLKELVEDIGTLLSRSVADAPELVGKAAQQRLIGVIQAIFKRQTQPIVLLLEDAQWTSESLEPLKALNELVESHPWLILVSYRDDEAPDLPASLPNMQVMTLGRFSESAISDLSVGMLGEAGRRDDLVKRLHEETEGNVYFLVEIVRALAEEAGSLGAVATKTLPRQIITGGVLEITRRRLAKVPESEQAALKLAAIAGRQIDLKLMETMKATASLDGWLSACANAAVIEILDGSWRFAHDKLRETLLTDLSDDERATLHRRVAEGIEAAYPDNKSYAEMLAGHWEQAGDPQKAAAYILQAVEGLITLMAELARSESLLHHALEITPVEDKLTRAHLYRWLGESMYRRSEHQGATDNARLALELNSDTDRLLTLRLLNVLAACSWRIANYADATIYGERIFELARELDNQEYIASAKNTLGIVASLQGRHDESREYFEQAVAIHRQLSSRLSLSNVLNSLGIAQMYQGEYEAARHTLEEKLSIAIEIGDRTGPAYAYNNLAIIAERQGDYAAAQEYLRGAIAICRETGMIHGVGAALANLGNIGIHLGQFAEASSHLEESLTIRRSIGDQWGIASSLDSMAYLARLQRDFEAAGRYSLESIDLNRKIEAKDSLVNSLINQGYAELAHGTLDQAQARFDEALTISQEVNDDQSITKALSHLCRLAILRDDLPAARARLREAIPHAQKLGKPDQADVLYDAARLAQADRPADAAAWAAMLEAMPETSYEIRHLLEGLHPTLQAALSPEDHQAAVAHGSTLSIDSVLQSLLMEAGTA